MADLRHSSYSWRYHSIVTDPADDVVTGVVLGIVALAIGLAVTVFRAISHANNPTLPPFTGWHSYFTWWLPLILFLAVLASMLFHFLTYADKVKREGKYLMDLEWRRIWPIFLILFTALPMGLPFYIVSAVRVQMAKRRENPLGDENLARLIHPVTEPRRARTPPNNPPPRAVGHGQATAPQAPLNDSDDPAKQHYFALRENLWQEELWRHLRDAHRRKEQLDNELRNLSQRIRQAQTQRNNLVSELRRYEAAEAESAEAPERVYLEAEFQRLMNLPGVMDLRLVDNELCLSLSALYQYEGHTYDLGDWELRFGAGETLRTRRLRSGLKPDWPSGRYPDYAYSFGGFCFGNRGETIGDNLRKGQFLEAIDLAVDTIQSINEEDQHKIPRAFRKVPNKKGHGIGWFTKMSGKLSLGS